MKTRPTIGPATRLRLSACRNAHLEAWEALPGWTARTLFGHGRRTDGIPADGLTEGMVAGRIRSSGADVASVDRSKGKSRARDRQHLRLRSQRRIQRRSFTLMDADEAELEQ